MKRAILSAAVVLGVSISWGQQDPQYSQFMYDKLSVNPGSAGIHGMYCGTVMYRNQWMGFDGSPKTILLNVDGAIPLIHGGVGLTFYNDKLGFETNNILRLSYSWHQPTNVGLFGFGLSAGMAQKALNPTWVPHDAGDTKLPGNEQQASFDLGLGVYWRSKTENTYAGLSATHLTGQRLDKINLDVARHFWVMAGHTMQVGPQWLSLSGDFMAKSDIASTQFDVGLRAWYDKMVYLGVAYRYQDAVYPMVGYHKQLTPDGKEGPKMFLTAGLSYDVTLSDLKNYSSGSVELFVKFCFKPYIKTYIPKPYDVRFLGT